MDATLFKYIFRHSTREQVQLVVLTGLSFPFLYYSLDLPKIIINDAIAGREVFPIRLPLVGSELGQIEYLLLLCGIFLSLVCINGGFKYAINVYAGVVGERMLRRLRYELLCRVMRFPLPHFRKVGQGEVVAMVVAETDPLGGFIGESVKLPAFQGGTLLTILVFMFVQDWVLGLAAIALYPVQMYVIPKLQYRVNMLKRDTVVSRRQLSERIGELVAGVQEVHAHDTSQFEGALLSERLGRLYVLRLDIYKRKFMIKFLNNFLAQVTPFFFYAIGGYLVIGGELTFGALVAVLAAYKDLNAPWKELLNYYQMKEDARIKYELLYETFQPAGMLEARLQEEEPDPIPRLDGEIVANRLDLREEPDGSAAGGISFRQPLPSRIAVVGESASETDRLALVLARLAMPLAGRITVGGLDLGSLPESVTGRRIAYVGQDPRLQSGTILDNLVYVLKHRPQRDPSYSAAAAERSHEIREAARSGNSPYDSRADWIDYEAAGADGPETLLAHALGAVRVADLERDVYQLGLAGVIDPSRRPDLAERIMAARADLRHRLQEPDTAGLVEIFDRAKYNTNMTIAENLLFGTPKDASFDVEQMADNAYLRKVLHETGLMPEFVAMGRKLAELMVDLFADVPADSDLFEQFSFISADDLPEFRNLLSRTAGVATEAIDPADRRRLLSLPFKLVSARHRLGLIDEAMQARLLHARRVFAGGFGDGAPPVDFFDAETYNAYGSIQDNILFGRVVYGRARSASVIGSLIRDVVDRQGLMDSILTVGLDFPVGIGAGRLSQSQRQKLSIARSVLKRPDLLIVDNATGALDSGAQERILAELLAATEGRGLIWVVPHAKVSSAFDSILVLESGRVVEQGTFSELSKPGTAFGDLLNRE